MTNETPRFTFDEKEHGAGGYARVLKGRDNALERDIAVKILSPLATEFPESDQDRFRREARILAKLSHPNIPSIHDVDFSPGTFHIIFEFIDGSTLRDVIDKNGACQLREVRRWFSQIASALSHAHELDVIHRDVKPANIIITPDRESAYLVDFGIALTADEAKKLTKSGFVIGTPGYMSPEQQRGEEVDHRTDIYSLAVTLYEALAGKPIPIGQYEELSVANEAIPPALDDLIRDCLRDSKERLDSVREFSSRLAGAVRPSRPLSEVLARGRLHELANAIEFLDADDLVKLPAGQRALILVKLDDIVGSGGPELQRASERLLELLLSRGIRLPGDDYRKIVSPAIRWAFERKFGGRLGMDSLRRALEGAAYEARGEAHDILREEFEGFLSDLDFNDAEDWYLHAIREVLEALLANPSCTEGASELAVVLTKVNKAQRAH